MSSEISIKDYVTNAYISFGKAMNVDRHLPYIYDGLKPVYQRLIAAALEFPDFIKSATVVGLCTGKFHPHGDKAFKSILSKMVKLGIFDGQGNFGYRFITGEVAEPAAMRYTEVRLNPEIKNQISKFMEFVPKTISESGYEMPTYIPTPIPFCLAEYTKVKLADGRSITMKELAIECEEGKENFLFSCSEDGEFRISKLKKCWKTKSVNKLIRITLDNGEVIDSTEDHKFMLRDGSYLPASELQVGTSLMPGEHKLVMVKSIEIIELNEAIDVYDLEVEDRYHNFLLDAGVIVHNCLIGGDQGIAIGINQRIPAFTAKSILEAYTKDDPTLLESQYGLILEKDKSGLKSLWETGSGRIYLKMKVTNDSEGATIEGDTSLFAPDLGYLFQEFRWGNIDYQDLSTDVGRVRFSRPPRSRKKPVSYIQGLVRDASYWNAPYYIRVHDDKLGFPISMRTWIDICYKNYGKLATIGISSEIKKLERKIYFYSNLKSVYSKFVNSDKSKDEIARESNVDLDLVKLITSKSADYVRNTDVGKEISNCESKISALKNNTIKNLIESYVGVLK